jgi:DUF4097 and DUF4098 domain-containing protein YvlB
MAWTCARTSGAGGAFERRREKTMKSLTFVARALVLIAVMLSIGACNIQMGNWAHFDRTVELQQPMADGGSLTVSTASGHIDVAGQAVSEVRVVATIRGQAPTEEEAQEIAEATEIRFESAGDKVAIKADTPKLGHNRSVSISYDIVVPTRTSVECGSASGAIQAAGLEGSVRANTASGSVTGENLRGGSVEMRTASGGVRLSDATELDECAVHSTSGRARAERVQAERIRIGSTSGSVELSDARAKDVEMRGTSGRVVGREIDCSRLSAESASGSVSVEFAPSAPADVTAHIGSISGGVNVTVPRGFAGRVELSTTSGGIQSDLPIQVQGRMNKKHLSGSIGQGSGGLTLRTTSGSVHVR